MTTVAIYSSVAFFTLVAMLFVPNRTRLTDFLCVIALGVVGHKLFDLFWVHCVILPAIIYGVAGLSKSGKAQTKVQRSRSDSDDWPESDIIPKHGLESSDITSPKYDYVVDTHDVT